MNYLIIFWGRPILAFVILWSLAVEEHYYLIYPSIFSFAWKYRGKFVAGLFAACIVVLAWRSMLVFVWSVSRDRTAFATDTQIDSILFGAILACILELPHWRGLLKRLGSDGVIMVALAVLLSTFLYRNVTFRLSVRYSLQGIALIPIFYAVIFAPEFEFVRKLLSIGLVTWIGRLSYSLYLWHIVVLLVVERMFHKATPVPFIVAFSLSFLAASVSYYGIERPFQKLRRKFRSNSGKALPYAA